MKDKFVILGVCFHRYAKKHTSQTLTVEHQRQVQVLTHQLNQLTKKPYATIYDNLKTVFGVPKYSDIPESEWDKVVNWFKVQIERAKKEDFS